MKNIELKPCPFCGGEAVLKRTPNAIISPYYVRCNNNDCEVYCHTLSRDTEEKAIEAWNRRVE